MQTHPLGTLKRAASSIRRLITGEGSDEDRGQEPGRAEIDETPHQARAPRRETDIPLDQLRQTYTPNQTSLKAPFRASGDDRQRDQEFALGVGDGRWSDEDRITNKSGDPRIGTHGRTYEPGERGGE